MKNYTDQNVYEAARERIEYCFAEFDCVILAFSGGKDSGVLVNLAYEYAKEKGLLDKVILMHIDHEAVYQMTREYVSRTFERFADIDRRWFCLPLATQCGCRMDADYWIPWLEADREKWVADMPDAPYIVNAENIGSDEFENGMPVYEFQMNYPAWIQRKTGKRIITLTGIRAGESFTRYMRSKTEIRKYKGKKFILEQSNGTYHGFPIYDWNTEDIWLANARFGWDYNRLYDLLYQAGLGIEQMRVASAFCFSGVHDIKMFKVIEPNTWGKLLSRVNGVSFAGIYGGTTAMGWKSITKPKHLTWKEYCYFLLGTLPEDIRKIYEQKLETSIKFWREKGGALSPETVKEIEGVPGAENRGKISKISDKDVITFEEYPDELDVTNFAEVPSYKRMCVCIMKNDIRCQYMGFAPTKQEAERRRAAMEKYKNL